MHLQWYDADQTRIAAVLDDGEQIGNLIGPTSTWGPAIIPADPANREFQDITARKIPIAGYKATGGHP